MAASDRRQVRSLASTCPVPASPQERVFRVALFSLLALCSVGLPATMVVHASGRADHGLVVRLVDNVHLAPDTVEELSQQVTAIWSAHGVIFDGEERSRNSAGAAEKLYILVRHRTPAEDGRERNDAAGLPLSVHRPTV